MLVSFYFSGIFHDANDSMALQVLCPIWAQLIVLC
uniref:Uncharacterized protein n=1 Tax=Arundo donax TaxID=35708 RepID=A0A0A9C3I9_ARUDO